MNYWSSLATAHCEFTFIGMPTFTASFSASASNQNKEVAMEESRKLVLKVVDQYIMTQPCLIKKDVKISYDVKYVHGTPDKPCKCHDKKEKLCDFSVYLNEYSGSFNYATDPYSDVPNTNVNDIIAYNDNGQLPIFYDPHFQIKAGNELFCHAASGVKLPNQPMSFQIFRNQNFFLEKGTILTTSVSNSQDEDGYLFPGTIIDFTIIGGEGAYINARGIARMEVGADSLTKITFKFK
jgi:hypothetical protein